MNDCVRADMRDRLPELMHGRLGAEERAEVERHVATCADCAAELELLRRARRALAREAPIDIQRIAAAVQREAAPPASAGRGVSARRVARGTKAGGQTEVGRRKSASSHTVDWRIAMAAALVIAVGLAITTVRRNARLRTVAVATTSRPAGKTRPPVTPAGAAPAPAQRAPVRPIAPAPAPEARHPLPRPAVLPDSDPGLMFGGGVSDLADGDVELLLQSVDSLTAVPVADPAPVVRGIDEGGLP
ncbi:MAG TPA: zf-HC2 domain-containing protein [Gemmatimonadaceae bacterium]|nr:zf-HC2 domain-containing protein [Gemmatimonadaceae bacterium]